MSTASILSVISLAGTLLITGMFRIGEPLNHQTATPGWVLLLTAASVVPMLWGYLLGRFDAKREQERDAP